jgi:hypothetical protein
VAEICKDWEDLPVHKSDGRMSIGAGTCSRDSDTKKWQEEEEAAIAEESVAMADCGRTGNEGFSGQRQSK